MLDNIKEAIVRFKQGSFVIVTDDEDREDEGDLIIGAEFVTKKHIAFMINYGKGLVCMPMEESRINELGLPMMIDDPEDQCANFTISVDAKSGSTGISASDRALTISTLLDPDATLDDFVMPGHLFPLRADTKGICGRPGHTEAAVDLCKLSNIYPAGVLTEILNDQGEPATRSELKEFSKKYNIPMISMEELKRYKDSIK